MMNAKRLMLLASVMMLAGCIEEIPVEFGSRPQLVMNADDVIRELMWDFGEDPAGFRTQVPTPSLTSDEEQLLKLFPSSDPLPLEILAERSGRNPGELAVLLIGLELSGAIRQLPGNRYMKL